MVLSYYTDTASRTFHLLNLVYVCLLEVKLLHLVQHCSELLGELVPGGRPCLDLLPPNGDLIGLPPPNEIHQAGKVQREIEQEAQTLKDVTRAADDQGGNHGVQDEVACPEILEQLESQGLKTCGGPHLQTQDQTEPDRLAWGKGQVTVSRGYYL